MDNIRDAHYFLLPTQGNIYSLSKICQTNGVNKILFASLRRKIYLLEYHDHADGCLKPTVREILFTYIPNGAEIISLDAFNKSNVCDDFFIGITIIKPNSEHNYETYLNIYSEQDLESNAVLNIESVAQNCLSIDLSFIPYQLYHTQLLQQLEDGEIKKEPVWLLSGSDVKVHVFREDRQNHSYSELDVVEYFPELGDLPSIVLWMDILHTHEFSRRITAIGCECGHMQIAVVDTFASTILSFYSNQFEGPISRLHLFYSYNYVKPPELIKVFDKSKKGNVDEDPIHLVVASTLQMSAVFMDITKSGLSRRFNLDGSDKCDSTLCSCLADIDMDGEKEIILGTYAQELLMYKYKDRKWVLESKRSLAHPIQSLVYLDITGDGMKELIVLTLGGLHVMQHNQDFIYATFRKRLQHIFASEDKQDEEVKKIIEEEGEKETDKAEPSNDRIEKLMAPALQTEV